MKNKKDKPTKKGILLKSFPFLPQVFFSSISKLTFDNGNDISMPQIPIINGIADSTIGLPEDPNGIDKKGVILITHMMLKPIAKMNPKIPHKGGLKEIFKLKTLFLKIINIILGINTNRGSIKKVKFIREVEASNDRSIYLISG
jgi:hypothetical protein